MSHDGHHLSSLIIQLAMSRTYRNLPIRHQFRYPKTLNELKQVKVSDDYLDTEYRVSTRNRYIPTAWDDITASSIYQNDHHP